MFIIIYAYVWIVFDTMHIQILRFLIFLRLKDIHSSAWSFASFYYLKPKMVKKLHFPLSFWWSLVWWWRFYWSMHSSCSCKSCELIWMVHFSCKNKSMFVFLLLLHVNYLATEDYKNSYELFIFLVRARTCLFCCCCHK